MRVQLLCIDDVRSWGVDLYVYQVLNDYREQKVGTIEYRLSSSSYTLSFNGSVPERFLYKDDNHFDMRAVPFAISDRGERVEGDAQTFLLKVVGCGCPDDNHPQAIDLGLLSGTKRSCCNVGASTLEEYGNYFAWDEGRFCKARNIFNCAENTNGRFFLNLPFVFGMYEGVLSYFTRPR